MRKGIVIIPARGGSKGLPRKNVKLLCGLPLIAWNIRAAMAANSVSQVVVSTDDAEIAQVARTHGASVVERPVEFASDTASSEDALLHALDVIESEQGLPELIIFMQCTSPLTQAEDIDRAVSQIDQNDADVCFSATESHGFLWKVNPVSGAEGVNHEKSIRLRRQDREPEFLENGAIYVLRSEGFRAARHRFFGKVVLSVMPQSRSFEVDDADGFRIVTAILEGEKARSDLRSLPSEIRAVVFDFDGVMSDNRVFVDQEGKEAVMCDRSDGMGISMIKKVGIRVAVLSTETNPVVSARCEKLKIECWQSLGDGKLEAFNAWCDQYQLSKENVVFVGNDVNDVGCLNAAGCGVVPWDAYLAAKNAAQIVLQNSGGRGAVRELCDLILKSQSN